MSYPAFPVQEFGGLDLVSQPDAIGAGGAVDISNVEVVGGQLRVRDGYNSVYSTVTQAITEIFNTDTHALISVLGTTVRAINRSTWVSAANTGLDGATFASSFTRAGPNGYTYFTGSTQIKRWDGAAFSSPAGLATIDGHLVATQPGNDRLVVASTNQSRVQFSNAGDPETFGANDYVEVDPGDGHDITGLAVFRELLFVFKPTRFYVFFGNSVDGTGQPVFNYRTVDVGVGCESSTTGTNYGNLCVTTGRDGVYFLSRDGVYRTTGDVPVRISDPIAPLWDLNNLAVPSTYGGTTADSFWTLRAVGPRIFLSRLTDGTFVWDGQRWTVWSLPMTAVAANDGAEADSQFLFSNVSSPYTLNQFGRAYTDDDGTAINSRYTSGIYSLANPGQTAWTRWTRLWGSGTPTVGVLTNYSTTDARAASVTLGTAPAVAEGYHQQSHEGQVFAHKLTGATPWSLIRLQHDIAAVR